MNTLLIFDMFCVLRTMSSDTYTLVSKSSQWFLYNYETVSSKIEYE